MFVVVVFLEAEAGRNGELSNALRFHAKTCLEREEGCHRFDISVDPLEGTSFLLYEVYVDEAAYLAHRELPHYADFRVLTDPWVRTRRVLTYRAVALEGAPE
jgi:(4S)-4-hydroxy-5-phosphonooxypentane-2,3-dione isomerase